MVNKTTEKLWTYLKLILCLSIIFIILCSFLSYNEFTIKQTFSKNFYEYTIAMRLDNESIVIPKTYRINTNSCKIIDLPLYDEQTKGLFEKYADPTYRCRQKPIQMKRFNETSIRIDSSALGYKPYCYYRQLSRGYDDNHYTYGQFNGPVADSEIHLPDYAFVHILCYRQTVNIVTKSQTINFTYDPLIVHNEIIPLIPEVNKTYDSSAPNVLLLAIDSTSYLNFKRHFIKSQTFLKKHNFFELRGYNMVGPNTFPNMIPFLTGHYFTDFVSEYNLKYINFDDWPLIWKAYSKRGFATLFVEEMPWFGLFNYELKGFKRQPTDYYTRPFHDNIERQRYLGPGPHRCYNSRIEAEHCLDYTYDFMRAMRIRDQKYFAYISVSEITHDYLSGAHYLDVPYNQFLTKIFADNLVDNTIIIFFSDHGYRHGRLRPIHTGEHEFRLPFMFIHLPDNMDETYVENLRQNQHRLTTPFDIHATLTHLISGKANHSLPIGLSLFEAISDSRDCSTAYIPEIYCSCYEDTELAVKDFAIIKPDITVPKLMYRLRDFTREYRSKCALFQFSSLVSVRKRSYAKSEYESGEEIFTIQFYANPGQALFETTLRSYEKLTKFAIIGDIIRINRYGDQSKCINDKLVESYCFCLHSKSNLTSVLS